MITFRPLDPTFAIDQQIGIEAEPVVLVNIFLLERSDEAQFLKVWHDDATVMKSQPGCISIQLHRALGENATYLNYAVWESNAAFRAAFSNPEFRSGLAAYPSTSITMPHLFQKVAVAGICTA